MTNPEILAERVERAKNEHRSVNDVIHKWLEGCDELIDDARLLRRLSDAYLRKRLQDHLPFSRLRSQTFMDTCGQYIASGIIEIKQLPIDNQYHLQFPLQLMRRIYAFMDSPCSLQSCHIAEPHSLPIIELRKSVMMDQTVEEAGGSITYDNRKNPCHIEIETIHAAYKALDEFITEGTYEAE